MPSPGATPPASVSPAAGYASATAICCLTAAAALPLHAYLDLANIVMLFLLAVFLVATFFGRGPAVMASFLAVALFDFFLVPPQLSFAVADAQYLVTFAVMLAVGLVTAHLVSRLADQTRQARERETEARQLYEAARGMAGAHDVEKVFEAARQFLDGRALDANLLLAADDGNLADQAGGHHALGVLESSFAKSAFQHGTVIEADSLAGVGVAIAFFPLCASSRIRGVLAITPRSIDTQDLRDRREAIEAVASLIALALERLHYAEATRKAELQVAEERLRTSVLSSLSHDLRTPLTTLVGLADTLARLDRPLPPDIAETAAVIRDQAQAMHRLLSDLLDMARLQGTHSALRREWQPLDDVVGSSLRLAEGASPGRRVQVSLAEDLPLLHLDAVLVERVLCNLLDNAFKYSGPGSRVTLSASRVRGEVIVSVCNEGSRFPPDRIPAMFDLFVRGREESNIPGVGLGLAICKSIVTAHGGSIWAENLPEGACVRFTLPCHTPPTVEEEER
ncbi:MAG: DUF4118 domain-containing protein [Rhodocyclaceae bacterium]|nr:DUF4118 domain-containing protein [Rhodocyclaceae bacterium]